jgi:hypothetical protein
VKEHQPVDCLPADAAPAGDTRIAMRTRSAFLVAVLAAAVPACVTNPQVNMSSTIPTRKVEFVQLGDGGMYYVIDPNAETCSLVVSTAVIPSSCVVLARNVPSLRSYITWVAAEPAPADETTAPAPAAPATPTAPAP